MLDRTDQSVLKWFGLIQIMDDGGLAKRIYRALVGREGGVDLRGDRLKRGVHDGVGWKVAGSAEKRERERERGGGREEGRFHRFSDLLIKERLPASRNGKRSTYSLSLSLYDFVVRVYKRGEKR